MEIEGAVAVVTGGGSGIGRAIALELGRQGADVVLADVNEERIAEARDEIAALGRRSIAVRTDVSKLEDVQNLYERAISDMGRVDILVNNAGVLVSGPPDKVPLSDWQWIIGINLFGVIHGVHVFLPHMIERGSGHIVNTASVAGLFGGTEDMIPYATTKFAVVGLSQGLAVYGRTRGVGVTVLCPGVVATHLMETSRAVAHGDAFDGLRQANRERVKKALVDGSWKAFAQTRDVVEPEDLAQSTVEAIRTSKFIVYTDEERHKQLAMMVAQDPEAAIEQGVMMAQVQRQMMENLGHQ